MTDAPDLSIPIPADDEVQPVTIIALTPEQWDSFRGEARAWRRFALTMLVVVLVTFGSVATLALSNRKTARNTARTVAAIDAQTSPEAQKRQADVLDRTVLRIDCNNRKAIEDALNQLAAQGFGLDPITIRCDATTTTSAPGS